MLIASRCIVEVIAGGTDKQVNQEAIRRVGLFRDSPRRNMKWYPPSGIALSAISIYILAWGCGQTRQTALDISGNLKEEINPTCIERSRAWSIFMARAGWNLEGTSHTV